MEEVQYINIVQQAQRGGRARPADMQSAFAAAVRLFECAEKLYNLHCCHSHTNKVHGFSLYIFVHAYQCDSLSYSNHRSAQFSINKSSAHLMDNGYNT